MESLLYSFFAGSSTILGAIILLFFKSPGKKTMALLLGFAGGIMVSLSVFELMPEALDIMVETAGGFYSMSTIIIGFLIGCGMMFVLDIILPHAHMSTDDHLTIENEKRTPHFQRSVLRTGYLIFSGIALHNIPEGIAIGAGLEARPELGLTIAIAIGLHNIPEGLAVAGPLKAGGIHMLKVIFLTLLAGLMTVIGTLIGMLIVGISDMFVAGSLAFAAGAMIYIVNDELIPQSNALHSHMANAGLISGLLIGFALL